MPLQTSRAIARRFTVDTSAVRLFPLRLLLVLL